MVDRQMEAADEAMVAGGGGYALDRDLTIFRCWVTRRVPGD